MFRVAIEDALAGSGSLPIPEYTVTGDPGLPSVFDVSGFAAHCLGAVCAEAQDLLTSSDDIIIDQTLAGHWFSFCIDPIGWDLPPVWDPIAGIYAASDGFIRLHTNAAHHKAAALSVLKYTPDRTQVAACVSTWACEALETAIVSAGGCAAAMRSAEVWAKSEPGRAVASEPLIAWTESGTIECDPKPLSDIKILDLTRVLAGPVGTRTLAGFGAQVLRIDPPGWEEGICEPEVSWGKTLSTIDLKTDEGRETVLSLLKTADILIHGYRSDALDGLGLGDEVRRDINPALIDIAHNAFGWTGPWSGRRGFDSLVQMSCGIAHAGMVAAGRSQPYPLPVQALDYGTGYLIAAAALRALRHRASSGRVMKARLSLARTAHLLMASNGPGLDVDKAEPDDADYRDHLYNTDWGPARQLAWPGPVQPVWRTPARSFHSDPPHWR